MKQLTNVWLDSLTTFDQVLEYIDLNLATLKENAIDAQFMDPAIKQRYAQDITFMKQFFERAEFLARAQPTGKIVRLREESQEVITELAARLISHKNTGYNVNMNEQIYGWIEKIQENVAELCNRPEVTSDDLIYFITHQYHLVMIIYRALTGRVIFVGARPIAPISLA